MHRIWAILLLAASSSTLMDLGVFASGSEPQLPSCCRAKGKHHCLSTATRESSSGLALNTGRCAAFPFDFTTTPASSAATIKPAQAIFAAVVSHPATQPQTEALARLSFDRGSQKRGPPNLT